MRRAENAHVRVCQRSCTRDTIETEASLPMGLRVFVPPPTDFLPLSTSHMAWTSRSSCRAFGRMSVRRGTAAAHRPNVPRRWSAPMVDPAGTVC
jgi:hypothetical protein